MKKNSPKIYILASLLAALLFAFTEGSGQAATQYYRWAAALTTSNWYPISVTISGKLEKDIPNLKMTVAPGGGISNPVSVGKGDAQLGWSYSTNLAAAYKGEAPYKEKFENLRFVATLMKSPLCAGVRARSDIKNWKDLIGKKIAMGPPTFAGNKLGRLVLETYGVDGAKMKEMGGRIDNLDLNASADQMKDGLIDCVVILADPIQATWQDLEHTIPGGIRFVGIDDATVWQKFFNKNPDYIKVEIPAHYGPFKAQAKSVTVPGDCSVIFARADVPDAIVYDVVKQIFDNLEDTRKIVGGVRNLDLETATVGDTIPVHPGALKYFKEKGMDTSKLIIK